MLIAQISDCHVTAGGRRLFDRVDSADLLRRAIEALGSLPRRPDLLVASGDLTENGSAEEYETFLSIAGGLAIPLLPVVGNHDERQSFAASLDLSSRFDLQPGFIQYSFEDGPVRILVLDTAVEGSGHGGYCEARLAWLQARLDEDERPTFIAMHHPPFPVGVSWMEPPAPDWAEPLMKLILRHPRVVRMVCGHVHRPMTVCRAGVCIMSAPSTAHQVFPDHTSSAPIRFNEEAPGFLLHQWTDGEMISYGVAVPGLHDTIDL